MALAIQPVQSWAEGGKWSTTSRPSRSPIRRRSRRWTFDRFEIAPIAMVAPYAGQPCERGQGALAGQPRRARAAGAERVERQAREERSGPRCSRIEADFIRHVKFVSGKARFWAGAACRWHGRLLMTVKLSDAATGEVIAEPEFYQHANAFGAAYSFEPPTRPC